MTNKLVEALYGGRPCPRGHGAMEKQPGIWMLQQVQRAGLLGPGANLHLTGKVLTMEAHICQQCGHVELINEGPTP